MKTYIVDVETFPQEDLKEIYYSDLKAPANFKDADKIKTSIEDQKKGAVKQMSLDPDYADIRCIAVKEIGKEARLVSLEECLEICYNNRIITFNGKNFDLNVLIKNGIKKGLQADYRQLKEMTGRYSTKHIDLMEVIGQFGKYKSLDKYLQIYLGIKKTPIDFDACTKEDIECHCLEDVVNTEKLFLLFQDLT